MEQFIKELQELMKKHKCITMFVHQEYYKYPKLYIRFENKEYALTHIDFLNKVEYEKVS